MQLEPAVWLTLSLLNIYIFVIIGRLVHSCVCRASWWWMYTYIRQGCINGRQQLNVIICLLFNISLRVQKMTKKLVSFFVCMRQTSLINSIIFTDWQLGNDNVHRIRAKQTHIRSRTHSRLQSTYKTQIDKQQSDVRSVHSLGNRENSPESLALRATNKLCWTCVSVCERHEK